MSTAILVPLSEYLETSYRPDKEYVDGELLERTLGETDHSRLQFLLLRYLGNREDMWGISVLPEQRVQVKPTRFRVPDITVVLGAVPTTRILHDPPFLCIEILSRDDGMEQMQERIDDYLSFGVEFVWVVNPRNLRGYIYTADGMKEAKDGNLRTSNPDISVAISELQTR